MIQLEIVAPATATPGWQPTEHALCVGLSQLTCSRGCPPPHTATARLNVQTDEGVFAGAAALLALGTVDDASNFECTAVDLELVALARMPRRRRQNDPS